MNDTMRYANGYSSWNPAGPDSRGRPERSPYGRQRRYGRSETAASRSPLAALLEPSESDGTVEIRDAPNRVEISADFPEVDSEDVDVSVSDSAIRLRARSDDEPRQEVERTIALTRNVVPERADVSRTASSLTVAVPKAASA